MVKQVFQFLEATDDVFKSQIVGRGESSSVQFGRQSLRTLPDPSRFKRISHCFLTQIFLRKQHSDLRPNLLLVLCQQGRRCLACASSARSFFLNIHIIRIPLIVHKSNNNRIYTFLMGFFGVFGFFELFVTYTSSIN